MCGTTSGPIRPGAVKPGPIGPEAVLGRQRHMPLSSQAQLSLALSPEHRGPTPESELCRFRRYHLFALVPSLRCQPDHRAGGTRMGAGRPLGATGQASGSGLGRADSEPVRQPLGASETRSRRPITGNGIANLAPMFMSPELRNVFASAEVNISVKCILMLKIQQEINQTLKIIVPFPFLPPESAQGDSDDDSETDSDFEDLLDEAIPSKPLLDEANASREG
ncbi:hypothetical protein B0H11DRAFT_1903801 [Mycena galericulata]|nr:hypothetical protein B0H11DRAFT_1903801 [Mycena galericulata]